MEVVAFDRRVTQIPTVAKAFAEPEPTKLAHAESLNRFTIAVDGEGFPTTNGVYETRDGDAGLVDTNVGTPGAGCEAL